MYKNLNWDGPEFNISLAGQHKIQIIYSPGRLLLQFFNIKTPKLHCKKSADVFFPRAQDPSSKVRQKL